jgi:D-glycero-D-manno-heptose 1,7-bisphosphate phosphatase
MVILDRDGVLNALVVDAEHGTIDSPLHPDQVVVFPWVPQALADLCRAGFALAIASNQPAAAKGKTSRENLERVHEKVLTMAESRGAKISSSHLCLHRQEDRCACRKPRTGLLEEALGLRYARELSWMVGDGVTDVEAGAALGLSTGFLGPRKCDACRLFEDLRLSPTLFAPRLDDFVRLLLARPRSG